VRLDQNLLELAVTTFPQLAAEQQRLDVLLTQMLPGHADAVSSNAEPGAGSLVLGTGLRRSEIDGAAESGFQSQPRVGCRSPESAAAGESFRGFDEYRSVAMAVAGNLSKADSR
jgi:hypothetical protein